MLKVMGCALIALAGCTAAAETLPEPHDVESMSGTRDRGSAGGPVGFTVRTAGGSLVDSAIVWTGDSRAIVAVNLTGKASPAVLADLYQTLRMQASRATTVELREAGQANGCCPGLTGSGNGYAGNVRAQIDIDQRLDGPDQVRQTMTITGYRGERFDDSTAKLLFQ